MSPLLKAQILFTKNVAKLISFIVDEGYLCTLGEVFRPSEMAEIYAKKGLGIKNSLHRDRLAIDINIFDLNGNLIADLSRLQIIGHFWQELTPKNTAGMFWARRDLFHFEMQP